MTDIRSEPWLVLPRSRTVRSAKGMVGERWRGEGGWRYEADDRGQMCQGVGSVAGVQVPPGCRYFAVQSGGKLFTGLFKRNLLKLTDFISRGTQPRGATPDYTLTKLAVRT